MSRIILYMAISADGFIAGPNNETPWTDAEWQSYREFVKSCDICLIGSRTYEVMHASNEFVSGVKYAVVTNNKSLDTGEYEKISIQTEKDIPAVEKIGVIGGGDLNGSLASLGLIDEVVLDIEPVVLGVGTGLFGSHNVSMKLRLVTSKSIGMQTIQNTYEVIK